MTDRLSNAPPVVSPHEWEAARQQLLAKEKASTRARDVARGGAAPHALDDSRERLHVRLSPRQTAPHRFVRKVSPVGDLSRILRARRVRLARACLSRLLADGRSGSARCPPSRTRHDPSPTSRALHSPTSRASKRGWAGRCRGIRLPTGSTPTLALTNGTGPTSSFVTATTCTARTLLTTAVTRRWEARGATSTSRR